MLSSMPACAHSTPEGWINFPMRAMRKSFASVEPHEMPLDATKASD